MWRYGGRGGGGWRGLLFGTFEMSSKSLGDCYNDCFGFLQVLFDSLACCETADMVQIVVCN